MAPFADVAIYLRKWISEAFAGIYGGQTIMFVWDYCFMHGWTRKVFYKIGLVTLMLIKPFAMEADNHRKMAKVLFNEPSNLYLKDLRTGLLHYEEIRNDLSAIQSITELNTNFEYEVKQAEEPSEENDENENPPEESEKVEKLENSDEPHENTESTESADTEENPEKESEKPEENADNPENSEKE